MAELFDLDALELFSNTGAIPRAQGAAQELLFDLGRAVRELRARRALAETDLRAHIANVAELGSLKRRITALRRSCRLRLVGRRYDTVRDVLREDDGRRRRFERKQKAARR